MTKLKNLLLAAALTVPGVLAAGPAEAQSVAVADPERAIAQSKAWTAARTQIQTTYKAQIDQAGTRERALQTELQPLVAAYQNASRAPNASQATVAPAAQALQTRQQAAQAELQRLSAPYQRAQAYAIEQISARLNEAVQGAVRARNVTLLVRPDAALFAQPTADITPAITAELDRLVPTVSTAVPANWQPGQQQAAQGAAGVAPAATTPGTTPRRNQGR